MIEKNKDSPRDPAPEKPLFLNISELLTRIELVTSTLPMLRTTDCAIAAYPTDVVLLCLSAYVY